MPAPDTLSTPRLRLRRFCDADRAPFAAVNADPRVMEHFPGTLDRAQSDALVDRIEQHWRDHGFGLWAVEVPGQAACIGFVGLSRPAFEADFTPCVEVGWRIGAQHWGHGFATEAARAALTTGFDVLGLDEIVSFTVPANVRSIRVMEKLGMQRASSFEHPRLPPGHPLRPHVLYRLRRT
jgi:RimJ/RimL family protein N-acetyltransferase